MDGEADRVGTMYGAYKVIMAAARQGTISPQGALRWARHVVDGRDVAVLASLAGPDRETRRAWMAQAARGDLAQRVLDILMQLVGDGAARQGPKVAEEFRGLWPPDTFTEPMSETGLGHYQLDARPLIHEPPDERGNRRARRGTVTPNFPAHTAYASSASPSEPGEMRDEEADALFPPRTLAEADRRPVAAAAPYVEDLADEDLHRLLFGDTTGGEAGR